MQTALHGAAEGSATSSSAARRSSALQQDGQARSTSQRLCALLRDPEIDVQNKAVDVVIKANHPDTMRYLIDVLKDENEYARRSAVEVLNEVGNAAASSTCCRR